MNEGSQTPTRVEPAILAVLALTLLAAGLDAILGRSAWYDEYYTFYLARAGADVADLWSAWLRDNHPPLYYFLAWATSWSGDTVPPRRLLNLVLAAGGAFALWCVARARKDLGPTLFAYALAVAGSSPFIVRVAELRSNFLAFAAATVAIAALIAFAGPRRVAVNRAEALLLGGALAVAFSVHLAATMIVGAMAAAFALRLVAARDWAGARRFVLICIAAAIPFVMTMAAQLGTIAANTRSFWIPAGFDAARWAIEIEILDAVGANGPFGLAGLGGLGLLIWRDLRARRLSTPTELALTLGLGLALAILVLLAVHHQRPFVIGRYLVSFHPVLAMILAIGVAALAQSLPRLARIGLFLVLATGAVLAIDRGRRTALALPGWDGTARHIARVVSACRGTVVHAATDWNRVTLALPPRDNRKVLPFAYAHVARLHHFTLAPDSSRALAATCPTIFWAEHVSGQPDESRDIAARLATQGYPVTTGALNRIGDGWVFVVPPARQN